VQGRENAGILREIAASVMASEICSQSRISDYICYNWKAKYGGMTALYIKRFRKLKDEIRRPRHLLGDVTLGSSSLENNNSKKILKTGKIGRQNRVNMLMPLFPYH